MKYCSNQNKLKNEIVQELKGWDFQKLHGRVGAADFDKNHGRVEAAELKNFTAWECYLFHHVVHHLVASASHNYPGQYG